ncbi:hypothetical protein HPB47_006444 [Ixodes persulcatus]|uniref:Uncharacterized protein n=1 Tax=Ixodes persulcatus TaxID=34615 RepID=A0AC60PA99_IXOPE|nr:hypothetical protein HPB47_006444 [Ixodes persulcatus]
MAATTERRKGEEEGTGNGGTARVDSLYNTKSECLHTELSATSFISLAADFWTSIANDAYLGVTAHWIDDDWVFRSSTLQVRHVPERHTAEQCAREVLEAAMAWEIDSKSLKCAAETLQLCIHKALSVTGVERLQAACRRSENLRCSMEDDSASKATVPRLTDVDWDMLEHLREALRPLLEVTELLRGDKYVTRFVLIPAIKLLKNKMRINDCDPAFICRFKAMLVDSIDEKLSTWPHYNDHEMATCLDPRFRSLACIGKDRLEHRLLTLLPCEAADLVSRFIKEYAEDYAKVKASLLRKYRLSTEAFRQRFRNIPKKAGQGYPEFAYSLRANLTEWLKSADAYGDHNKVVEYVAVEQFHRCLPDTLQRRELGTDSEPEVREVGGDQALAKENNHPGLEESGGRVLSPASSSFEALLGVERSHPVTKQQSDSSRNQLHDTVREGVSRRNISYHMRAGVL